MPEQTIAVICISSKVTTLWTQFHQCYISVLQREAATVFLSSLDSILKVPSKEVSPVAKLWCLIAF